MCFLLISVKGRDGVFSLSLVHGMVNIHVLLSVFDSLWRVVKCGKSNAETGYHRGALAKRGDSQTQGKDKMSYHLIHMDYS